jgi:hypothetical protein
MNNLILFLILYLHFIVQSQHQHKPNQKHPYWLVNNPVAFHNNDSKNLGQLLDVRMDPGNITFFIEYCDYHLHRTTGVTDGENIDAVEHYFWGLKNGIAMELGALDGSSGTRSMTHDLEAYFNWKRILVEGDPTYRDRLNRMCPHSLNVNAAICEQHTSVNFITTPYVGGIVEFMSTEFLKNYHSSIYDAIQPPNNLSTIDWSAFTEKVVKLDCIPLSAVFHRSGVKHVNFFILDVEVFFYFFFFIV